ncbi:hypothetical protein ACJJTC_010837 [Scirpophaga incertulas]
MLHAFVYRAVCKSIVFLNRSLPRSEGTAPPARGQPTRGAEGGGAASGERRRRHATARTQHSALIVHYAGVNPTKRRRGGEEAVARGDGGGPRESSIRVGRQCTCRSRHCAVRALIDYPTCHFVLNLLQNGYYTRPCQRAACPRSNYMELSHTVPYG